MCKRTCVHTLHLGVKCSAFGHDAVCRFCECCIDPANDALFFNAGVQWPMGPAHVRDRVRGSLRGLVAGGILEATEAEDAAAKRA